MSNDTKHAAGLAEQAGIVLFSQWGEFCRLRKVVRGLPDTDSIHDLRVASRRLRATLGLFGPLVAGNAVRGVSREVKRITRSLGHVRNIDEALIYFEAHAASIPTLAAKLRIAGEKERRRVFKELKAFPVQTIDGALRNIVSKLSGMQDHKRPDKGLPAFLSERSIRYFQQLHDLLAPALSPENVEGRHRLRIAIKKWRYLLETIGLVCGQDYTEILETLKRYQTILGNLNDMVAFGALCDSLEPPHKESQEVRSVLARDAERFFMSFTQMAAMQPLQYTFHL